MTKNLRLSLLIACVALVGCVGDETASPAAAIEQADSDAKALAASLVNYAVANALPSTPINTISSASGSFGVSSIVCPLYDGTNAGMFFAWAEKAGDADPAAAAAAMVAHAGRENVARATKQGLVGLDGQPFGMPSNCGFPDLPEGTPVVRVRLNLEKLPAFSETSRVERRAEDCPEGYTGAVIKSRIVQYSASGLAMPGPWGTDDMGACKPVTTMATTAKADTLPAWEIKGDTDLERELAANLPRDCKTVTVNSKTTGAKDGAYTVSTCEGAKQPDRLAWVEPESNPAQNTPPVVVSCPKPDTITLPSMSSVHDYEAAIAPYAAMLPLPAGCSLSITSTAVWPFWQTFAVFDTRNPSAGTYAVTRLYSVKLNLSWSATGGASRFTEWHELPRQGYYAYVPQRYAGSIEEFPTAFETYAGGSAYLYTIISTGGVVAQYRLNGVLHPKFTGPHTRDVGNLNGVYPELYMNKAPDPELGNTAEQQSKNVAVPSRVNGNLDERGTYFLGY